MNDLVAFWREYDEQHGAPFLHPKDFQYMQDHGGWQDWGHLDGMQQYLIQFGERQDYHFHLALQPFPFAGNLKKADVVILMLNPRFILSEYYADAHQDYRGAIRHTLAQDFDGCTFPFVWLNPEFSWCDGFVYWEGKLRQVLTAVAQERFNGNYWEALREASKRVALIELVAYQSLRFPQRADVRDLPSANAARAAAGTAAERALEGRAVVVGNGGYERWAHGKECRVEIQRSRAFSLSRDATYLV